MFTEAAIAANIPAANITARTWLWMGDIAASIRRRVILEVPLPLQVSQLPVPVWFPAAAEALPEEVRTVIHISVSTVAVNIMVQMMDTVLHMQKRATHREALRQAVLQRVGTREVQAATFPPP